MKLMADICLLHIDIHILHTHSPKHPSKLFAQNEHGKFSHKESHWMELFVVTFILLWAIRHL